MAGVSYKPGVSGTPTAAIQFAIEVASNIYASFGVALVVTSLRDGQHVSGSLHYSGNAVDLRRWDLDEKGMTSAAVNALRSQLGNKYRVILESDHIHIQYQGGPSVSPQPGQSQQSTPFPEPSGESSSLPLWIAGIVVVILLLR